MSLSCTRSFLSRITSFRSMVNLDNCFMVVGAAGLIPFLLDRLWDS